MLLRQTIFRAIGAIILLMSGEYVARADGPAIYATRCASCHGETGRGDTPVGRALGIPSFQGATYSRNSLDRLLRSSESHKEFGPKLNDADRDALVDTLNALAAED